MSLRTIILNTLLGVLPGATPAARITVEQPLQSGGRDIWTGTAAPLADRITDAIEGKDTQPGESTAHRLALVQNVLAGVSLHWNPAGQKPSGLYAAQAAALYAASLVRTREETAELETGVRTVYRAEHETIPLGTYTTEAAARAHAEGAMSDEFGPERAVTFDWVGDESDLESWWELVVQVDGGDEQPTGYVVVPITVASAYDPEAEG
ncbi:hypothetical protein ABZ351_18360 [Streptomyces microflavus]|uniref:hypothetical protein n=1 Tax=Streptomyces microflavus TaxID=1919 RepID=UPI0033CD83BE